MPRPSDLYATLGTPGMYQSTPWTPRVIPNVFVYPPEEDNEDIYCLFHSGSASPSTFESFYRNGNGNHVYTRRHPSSPTLTDLTVLDHALSYIQQQASAGASAPAFGRKPGWEHGEHVVMPTRNHGSPASSSSSRSSSSGSVRGASIPTGPGTTVFPNLNFLVEEEGQAEGQVAPTRPASRRSSVFGERPFDYEASSDPASREEPGSRPLRRSHTMTLKSRAAIVLKSMGSTKARRSESDVRVLRRDVSGGSDAETVGRESFFFHEQGTAPLVKPARRKTLAQLFGSNSNVDGSLTSSDLPPAPPTRLPPPPLVVGDSRLNKRKSVSQLFGLTRSSSAHVLQPHKAPAGWELLSGAPAPPLPLLPSPEAKLIKRKSVSQLIGLGRSTSSTPTLVVGVDELGMDATEVRLATLRALEGPSSPDIQGIRLTRPAISRSVTAPSVPTLAQSQGVRAPSPPSEKTNAPSSRRKSFLSTRAFSFLDVQRHFSSHSASDSPVQTELSTSATPTESPNSPNELTDSSSSNSNPPSTDSEPETEDTVRVFEPRMAAHSHVTMDHHGNAVGDPDGPVEVSSSHRSQKDQESDVFSQFSLHEPKNFDLEIEDEANEQLPQELATKLDSLTFDQLAFNPESFASGART